MEDERKKSVMVAVETGDSILLGELLKSTNMQDSNVHAEINLALMHAVLNEKNDIVEQLLLDGADADFLDCHGYTPLVRAILVGNLEICNLLLKSGANVHDTVVCSIYTHTPNPALYYAVCVRNVDIVALLLEHGAYIFNPSLEPPKTFGNSPIPAACKGNCYEILDYFLQHRKAEGRPLPLRPLFKMTMKYDSEDCAIVVLMEGYCPLQDVPYESCFKMAAAKGMTEVMSFLLGMDTQFMQEDWVIGEQLPNKLKLYRDFVSCLLEYRKQRPFASLQSRCKARICKELGEYYVPKIDALCLPKALKTYLAIIESPLPGYDSYNPE